MRAAPVTCRVPAQSCYRARPSATSWRAERPDVVDSRFVDEERGLDTETLATRRPRSTAAGDHAVGEPDHVTPKACSCTVTVGSHEQMLEVSPRHRGVR